MKKSQKKNFRRYAPKTGNISRAYGENRNFLYILRGFEARPSQQSDLCII